MRRRDLLKWGMAALSAQALPRGGVRAGGLSRPPVRLIVPFPPGGAFDTIGRPWAERIKPHLGTMVIENIGGAGGGVGAAQAARSRPDGYTLLLGGATTHITEALLKTKPTYDPLKDLEPISPVAVTAFAIAVHPSVPVKDLKELVAYVKANPGKMSYGSAGHGSLNHLTGELFKLKTGLTDFPHVPYRGAGPGLTDLLAGQIPALVPAMTNIVAGASPRRKAPRAGGDPRQAPGGRAGIADRGGAGIPRSGGAELHRPVCAGRRAEGDRRGGLRRQPEAVRRKSYQELLISGTFELEPLSSPAEYKRYVESELARWKPIVTAMGIKID